MTMKILFISTINGKLDEGMRNVATHIAKGLEVHNIVRRIQLKDFKKLLKNLFWCEQVLICARADKKMYMLLRFITIFKHCSAIIVQRPTSDYLDLIKRYPLRILYFTISNYDTDCIPHLTADQVVKINVGIDADKFRGVDCEQQKIIKKELGIQIEKPLIIHVGHCSSGRKVERICRLNPEKYERIVITSGMFEDGTVRALLDSNNVKVLSGYLPDIEKYYQAADAYIFPTDSGDYVISIPLSVMEALSSGTAVVAFDKLSGLKEIEVTVPSALQLITDEDGIESAIEAAIHLKTSESYLKHPYSWDEIAGIVSSRLESNT